MTCTDDAGDAFLIPADTLYFDTASFAPRLRAVDAAAHAAWAGGLRPWTPSMPDWEAALERVRTQASRLFFADAHADPDGVALLPSVAYSMALLARGWPLKGGDVVAMVDGEFPSTLMAWQARCAETGARLLALPREDPGGAVLQRLGRERVDLLVLSQLHWRDGRLLDLDAVAIAAHAHGVPVVLDLSQSLGALPCDVVRWRPAAVASVGYKWLLGGKGLGALWLAPEWRERLAPLEQHWQQRRPAAPWGFGMDAPPPTRAGARRLDAGEIADPLRLAIAEAGLAQVLDWSPRAIAERLGARMARFSARLDAAGLDGWRVTPASPHVLGLRPPPARLAAVRASLAREGLVCAERDGVFRLSPHLHIGEAEIDRAAAAFIRAR
jgi:selenocysteine lyase/cysteine desulfurase